MRLDTDPYLDRYAGRVQGLTASAIRALFSIVSRPEVVSFAGGMPATDALDLDAVGDVLGAIVRDHGAEALQYGIGQGRPLLREALVQVMAHEGVPAHADDVVVTVGGQQALELVATCFVDPGDVVVAEGPTYVGALGALATMEADVRHVPLDADGMRTDLLEDLLDDLERDGRRVTFVYTVPNHHNPGGVTLSPDRRHDLVRIARDRDLMILEDNPYGLLDFDGKTWTSIRELAPERTIYVGTVSKTFAPGARIGWVVAPPPVRDKIVLLREAADLCPSNLTQMLVESWLWTQPWQHQVETFRGVYRERADTMLTALAESMPDGVTWTRPTGGFYVWLGVPAGIDTGDLLAKAIEHRVAFVPGPGFYADGGGGSHLRLCYSFPPPDRIREGVGRLADLLHAEVDLIRAVYGDRARPAPGDTPHPGAPTAGRGG